MKARLTRLQSKLQSFQTALCQHPHTGMFTKGFQTPTPTPTFLLQTAELRRRRGGSVGGAFTPTLHTSPLNLSRGLKEKLKERLKALSKVYSYCSPADGWERTFTCLPSKLVLQPSAEVYTRNREGGKKIIATPTVWYVMEG